MLFKFVSFILLYLCYVILLFMLIHASYNLIVLNIILSGIKGNKYVWNMIEIIETYVRTW